MATVSDRILIEIMTTANLAGVNAANGSLLGLGALTAATTAGVGLLVEGLKSMIDISEKHDQALQNLREAYLTTRTNLAAYQGQIDEFIRSNDRFISDQSAVVNGYANLTRSGLSQTEVQKDMNRALDLASLKHIDLGQAVELLIAAEHGRLRGLIDLGISTTKYTDANGNLVKGSHDVKKAFGEIDAKITGGRNFLTPLEKSSNHLSNQWQNLANKDGPTLLDMLDQVIGKTSDFLDLLSNSDKGPDSGWGHFQNGLIYWLQLAGDAIAKLGDLGQAWDDLVKKVTGSDPRYSSSGTYSSRGNPGGRDHVPPHNTPGAPVAGPGGREGGGTGTVTGQGGSYSPGGRAGGTQTFASGGGGVTVNVYGYVGNSRELALTIREGLRQLDREQR